MSISMSVRARREALKLFASVAYVGEYPLTEPVFVQTVSLRMPSSVVHFAFHLLAISANHANRERRPSLMLTKVPGPIMGTLPGTAGHASSRTKRWNSQI